MSHLAGVAALGKIRPITLSGSLSKTATPSGGSVSSDTVNVTVPPGNPGNIRFSTFTYTGTVTTNYSKNGGGPTAITDPTTVGFANSDTLSMRMGGATAGEEWNFVLTDTATGTVIGSYQITAS